MPDSPVRYVRVKTEGVPFAPAVRAYGNIAVIGVATPPTNPPADFLPPNTPYLFTDVNEARRIAAGPLGDAIATALVQEPGPSEVWGVRLAQSNAHDDAFTKVGTLNVQIVVVADTELTLSACRAAARSRRPPASRSWPSTSPPPRPTAWNASASRCSPRAPPTPPW